MANLGPLYQNQTYSNLLQVDGGLTDQLKPILDGDGNESALSLSLTSVGISGLVADSATNLYGGAAGSIPFQLSSNITRFVPAGASGYVLASNAGAEPYWTNTIQNSTFATLSNDIAGGEAGSVPYQVGVNDTSFTAVGSAGQVLVSGGSAAPYWSTSVPAALAANLANDIAGGSAGNLLYQVTANSTEYVTNGTSGQLLKSQGSSAPVWSTITASEVGAVPLSGGAASPMTGDLWMGYKNIKEVAAPLFSTDAANKYYVDSVASGLKVKAACRVATTANVTLSGSATIDGVSVNTFDRVLVKNQTDQTENGIYDVDTTGSWTRSSDANTWTEIVGATTFITEGSANINTTWTCNSDPAGTLGIDDITFVIFGASTSYTAGTGLTLTGSEFSLNTPVTVANGGSGAATLTGILKGNGTSAFSAATAADVVSLIGSNAVANATTAASCSGNAATATALQTARTINGVSFNGTANITVTANTPYWCYFTAGGAGGASGTYFNGSAAQNISYNTIGAAAVDGTNATGSWPINVTGTSSNVTGTVSVLNGGTGSSTASGARYNLGAAASGSNIDITSVLLNNTGLKVKSTNPTYGLTIAPGSSLTADRTLTVTTGDASRTLDISAANVTISSVGASFLAQTDAASQRSALGLGSISTQNSNNVSITGGNLSGNIGTAGSFLNFQSNALYITAAGRTGFGVTNPGTKVAIQSTGLNPLDLYRTDGNNLIQMRGASTSTPGAIAMSGDSMQLLTGGSARLVVDSAGITAQGTLNATNAAGSRTNLGLGNIATINTTGSTANFLRADGTWAAPTSATIYLSVKDYGAVGDNSTNDYTAFVNAIAACISQGKTLYIPKGNYAIGSQITITSALDILSDLTANIRFTNSASSGFVFNYGSSPAACSVVLPNLYGAGISSAFTYPGYPSSWTGSSRYGTAVSVIGGYCQKFFVNWINGWQTGFQFATANVSGVTAGNIDINIGNIDLCEYGIRLSSVYGTTGIDAVAITANTVFAKYIMYFDASYNISGVTATIASVFANESGGSVIYAAGTGLINSTINVNSTVAGYWGDSPTGTSSGTVVPYISGDQTYNGEAGFFRCSYNKISIQPNTTFPAYSGTSLIPTAGGAIRIKDGGTNNQISAVFDYVTTSPIAVSTSPSEGSYNGGVGGAQYSKYVYCSYTLASSVANGSGAAGYMFHQLVPSGSASNRPINLFDRAGNLMSSQMFAYAVADTSSVNRRINIYFTNRSGATIASGTTYYFWVEVG